MEAHNVAVEELKEWSHTRKAYDSTGRKIPNYDSPWGESRVFLNFKGETIFDNLNNRRQRPYTTIKPLLIEELAKQNISYTKLRWSQKAGCRLCPCSPGFVLEGNFGKDYTLTITDETPYPQVIEVIL